MNEYLSIYSDGFNFLKLWQMMPKIIEYFFFVFIVNVKKIVTYGVSKIYKWILRDTYRWVKCLNLWQLVAKIIEEYFSKS